MSNQLTFDVSTIDQPSSFKDERFDMIHQLYTEAKQDRLAFWNNQANQLVWQKKWTNTLMWDRPHARWFSDGILNAADNCLDAHLTTNAKKTAIIWESETGDVVHITYEELSKLVNQLANCLRADFNIQKGDRVTIYLPQTPEAAVAMLACAKIGAIHSVVFAGFSAPSLAERIKDSSSSLIITALDANRRGKRIPLLNMVHDALKQTPTPHVPVLTVNGGGENDFYSRINAQPTQCQSEPMASEDPLFILYTSGTTGHPKGILHSTGGYLTHAKYSTKLVFDLTPSDIFWCTADVGWITGHTYVVYGPLLNGGTILMFEGTPDYPNKGRFWECIEKHRVSIFYTAPTAIRAFMKDDPSIPQQFDLSSLRLLGSVGEPINPEAWHWYYRTIGKSRCPIVDTWWQTETGGIMLTSLPGYHPMKPGVAGAPLPGLSIDVLSQDALSLQNTRGFLSVTEPWPSMTRGIWNNTERFKDIYWSTFDTYFAGDSAYKDDDNDICVIGRVDDVLNVAGHRIGTMEIESALVAHDAVAEAAVVGVHDDIKGQSIAAFVILNCNHQESPALLESLKAQVVTSISPIAKPKMVIVTPELPKTRSGKIMRRLLKQLVEKTPLGDITTLAQPDIIPIIQKKVELS
jgi:acetyl-CoA synthetase